MKDIRSAENNFDFFWYFISFSNCIAHLQPSNMVRLETTFILIIQITKQNIVPDFLLIYLSSFLTPFISSWSKSRLFLSRRKPPSCCAVRLFSTSSSRPRLDCRLIAWSLDFVYLTLPFLSIYRLCGIIFIKKGATSKAKMQSRP